MATILVKKLNPNVKLPSYMTDGAAGADVYAFLPESVTIAPGQRVKIPTGLFLEIPYGFEVQVRPRSGLALKKGITVLNAPGTIDSDFRGEVQIILINLGDEIQVIEPEERIAQFVLSKVEPIAWQGIEDLSVTERKGGFGSTGLSSQTI